MPRMRDLFPTSRPKHGEFLGSVRSTHASWVNNPEIPLENWPDTIHTLQKFQGSIDEYEAAFNAAIFGDRQKSKMRDELQEVCKKTMLGIATYLDAVALCRGSNYQALFGSGLAPRTRSSSYIPSTAPLAVPTLSIRPGDARGTMVATADKIGNAFSYDMQITDGDPKNEDNWKHYGVFGKCNRMEINNLDPAKSYFFRLRAVGANSNGPWSPPVTY